MLEAHFLFGDFPTTITSKHMLFKVLKTVQDTINIQIKQIIKAIYQYRSL